MLLTNTYIVCKYTGAMRTDFRDFEERLYRVAETQGGCFTAKQALHAGYSYRLQHY